MNPLVSHLFFRERNEFISLNGMIMDIGKGDNFKFGTMFFVTASSNGNTLSASEYNVFSI